MIATVINIKTNKPLSKTHIAMIEAALENATDCAFLKVSKYNYSINPQCKGFSTERRAVAMTIQMLKAVGIYAEEA